MRVCAGAYVPANTDYPVLGSALAALLPLVGAGSKTSTVQGIEAGFNTFYAAKTNDTIGLVLADVNACALYLNPTCREYAVEAELRT